MKNNDTIFSEIKTPEVEVTTLQGLLTRMIDFLIDMLILYLIYLLMPGEVFLSLRRSGSFLVFIIVLLAITAYRLIFLMLFNKTIGMMVMQGKVFK